jgi:aspartyl-tRNA(Asn)/glutamyl-tRNA(Gln) amidotransferase subunit B
MGETQLMRIKESAHDYRYFPDPDLMPVKTKELLAAAKELLPELPAEKRARYEKDFGVSEYDAAVLADNLELGGYFEQAAAGSPRGKQIANWILNDLQSALSSAGQAIAACPIKPAQLDGLIALVAGGQINGKQAKEVFAEMFASGREAAVIVEEKGLKQESDAGAIGGLCDEVMAANPQSVADYKAGKEAALNFLKGQVMKLSKGKANPGMVGDLLAKKLG